MDFFDLVKRRRSVHHFVPNFQIPKEDFLTMIEYAGLSPSGYNAQPWEFIVVTEKDKISQIHEIAYEQNHIKDASAVIIALADKNIGRNVETLLADMLKFGYCSEDEIQAYRNSIAKNRSDEKRTSMAIRNAMLACMTLIFSAENMGYGTCPIMGFHQWKLEELLKIPDDRAIALMIAIGKPITENELPRLPRKPPSDLIHWEEF